MLRRRNYVVACFEAESYRFLFFPFLFFSLLFSPRGTITRGEACKNSCVTHRNWSLSDEHERANSRFAVSTISRPRYARHTLRIIESLPSRCNSNESPNTIFLFFYSRKSISQRDRSDRNFELFIFHFLRRGINRWNRWRRKMNSLQDKKIKKLYKDKYLKRTVLNRN